MHSSDQNHSDSHFTTIETVARSWSLVLLSRTSRGLHRLGSANIEVIFSGRASESSSSLGNNHRVALRRLQGQCATCAQQKRANRGTEFRRVATKLSHGNGLLHVDLAEVVRQDGRLALDCAAVPRRLDHHKTSEFVRNQLILTSQKDQRVRRVRILARSALSRDLVRLCKLLGGSARSTIWNVGLNSATEARVARLASRSRRHTAKMRRSA